MFKRQKVFDYMDMPSNVRGALASIYSYNSNGTFILIDTVEDQEVLALIKEDEGMDTSIKLKKAN